ncbi:IclR family transcriptional regulator [Microcella indica]|uniref:IclR family transcriptional regulator n=1 Tax=Microcella indica TaxID=2750620 RepID=UPI001C54FBD3|nr:IclR family transcriptional regulator [Microcella indica]
MTVTPAADDESDRSLASGLDDDHGKRGMLQRAMSILSSFRPTDTSVSPTELAKRAGLSKATGHRIVKEMLELGFLERSNGGVRLGLRMFEIGQLVPRQRNLRRAALPLMHDLREAIRATVHLAVLDGTDVLYIDILGQSDELPSRIGGRLPSYATGVGKAMLAFAPLFIQEQVLEGEFLPYAPGTIRSRAELESELESARRWGVAYDREESTAGVVCAAAPILSLDGALLGGLSVSSRVGQMNLQQVAPAVHTAALTLGRMLAQEMAPRFGAAPIAEYDDNYARAPRGSAPGHEGYGEVYIHE